jgi:hypothetical protein
MTESTGGKLLDGVDYPKQWVGLMLGMRALTWSLFPPPSTTDFSPLPPVCLFIVGNAPSLGTLAYTTIELIRASLRLLSSLRLWLTFSRSHSSRGSRHRFLHRGRLPVEWKHPCRSYFPVPAERCRSGGHVRHLRGFRPVRLPFRPLSRDLLADLLSVPRLQR